MFVLQKKDGRTSFLSSFSIRLNSQNSFKIVWAQQVSQIRDELQPITVTGGQEAGTNSVCYARIQVSGQHAFCLQLSLIAKTIHDWFTRPGVDSMTEYMATDSPETRRGGFTESRGHSQAREERTETRHHSDPSRPTHGGEDSTC